MMYGPARARDPPFTDAGLIGSNALEPSQSSCAPPRKVRPAGPRRRLRRSAPTRRRLGPLIHLFGIIPDESLPIWPVYVVGFDTAALIC